MEILLRKIYSVGLSAQSIAWFESYLFNPINTGLFWAPGVDTMCPLPVLKPEKPSPRVNNGNIRCLKS